MSTKNVKNMAASVRQKLLNKAKAENLTALHYLALYLNNSHSFRIFPQYTQS